MSLRSCLSSLAVCALVFVTFLTTDLAAQRPRVLAPHKPVAPRAEKQVKSLSPATQRSMVGGLWMTDVDFKSYIYLKNGVETGPVTATPILHLSNGAQYTLPDVTVNPAGLAIISINDELQKQGISSWATLSGYVELLYTWPWDPFCATVRNVDVAHSLIFTYPLRATAPSATNLVTPIFAPPTHTVEGMWWKHEKNVTGFIAIANLASQSADATVQTTDGHGLPIGQHTVSITPHGMKLIQLPELQTSEATNGGVLITSSETADNLAINGGLEDQTIGYSAGMPFAAEPLMQSEPEPVTIAELGLMSGAADPMMLFPAGTTFTPYSILRNVSDAALSITPTLWWMEGGTPHSALLPQITLPSLQTQSLDLASLLALFGPKNFNGSFNLAFETQATFGSLVMASGSVDQTGTYVFEVGPRGVGESASKSLQQWSTGNGDDTMVTVWNPADEAQDFVFTLFFEGGHYLLPLHIQPKETRSFDVSEIIQNQVPDAEGNLVPSTVHQGTAKIAGSLAENQYILVAIESGIYNVRKATCSQSCQWCDGYNSFYVVDAPFSVAVNGTHQESAMAQYHSGSIYNLTSASSWGSSNTTVATVGTGLVTGKASGSATITATLSYAPVDAGYICTGGNPCPESTFQNSGGGGVANVNCTSSVTRGGTATCTATGASGSTFSNWKFTDTSNNPAVTSSSTSATWAGVMVTSGTVSVTVTSSGASATPTGQITVNNRTNFAFTAVSPSQASGNSITCYNGSTEVLPSPPVSTAGPFGASCPDLAFSYQTAAPISDNGPNNGYQYVTSVSSTSGSQPTKFQYIVVSDLLSATTFYNAQCGNYSSSNSTGFIAGSQLNQNVFDHESGSVMSHWTEYSSAQNNSSNNIGTVLEAMVAPPSMSQATYEGKLTDAGNAAINNILTAVAAEPCNGEPRDDSSQSCKYCGNINFSPYQSCGNSKPVPYCH